MEDRTITLIPAKPISTPTQDRPFHVAAYCRVSSPSDAQELSLDTQVQYYTSAIENNAFWKSVGIYADTATGRNVKRRGAFKELLAKCRIGKVDLILTKSISRFGRNSLDTIKALRELKDNRVDVYFEQENIHLLDPAAQHVIEIYCALAQNESENKSHSIRWGIQAGFQGGTSGFKTLLATVTALMRKSKAWLSYRKRPKWCG